MVLLIKQMQKDPVYLEITIHLSKLTSWKCHTDLLVYVQSLDSNSGFLIVAQTITKVVTQAE